MFTLKEASDLGWDFVVKGENGGATKNGVEMFQVTSGIPMFALLSEVAEREGKAPLERTPEAIKAATGESYTEPAADTGAALEGIRTQRDQLLAESDWTQLLDTPFSDVEREAWASYRQQLRDFPAAKKFDPLNPPVWPSPPTA